MDSIGDYVYLIVIVIAAISGILKKKTKENAKPVAAPAPKDRTSLDDMIREFMNETKQEEQKKAEAVPEPVVFKPRPYEKVVSYENTADASELRAKKEIIKHNTELKKSHSDLIPKNILSNREEIFEMSAEDARKAIIFSEIINRKY